MSRPELIDTFPDFEKFWRRARHLPRSAQIDRWEHEYMARWPELLAAQKKNYSEAGVDWMQIARHRIFPYLAERLPRMRRLHRNLLRTLPDSWSRTCRILKSDFPVRFVIYVGIGVGAGWATRLGGRPACLFGLENAAELATGYRAGTPGAVSHEVAHLVHDAWRRAARMRGIAARGGPYWQLYVEGFATECERRIDGPRSFAGRTGRSDWLEWCTTHRSWLAAKFLRDVRARRSVRAFFGSWYDLRGQVECGYFLGQEVVREWADATSLKSVALLPERDVARRVPCMLRRFARAA